MPITKRTRRAMLGVVAAISAAALVTACGSSTPGEAAPENSDNATTGEGSGATTVEFWHRTFTPAENEWYKAIVEKYNAAQDQYVVNVTEVPADAWDQKMKAAQAAGNAPDIYTHAGAIEEAVGAGQLHELNGIVDDAALQEITENARRVSEIDGTFYAYPLLLEPQTVLFWNKDMFTAAGLDAEMPPKTWDELFSYCEKIQPTLGEGQFCIAPADDAATMAWATNGLQYNFSDHFALTDDWTAPNINNAEYRQLFDNYKKLYDNKWMPAQAMNWYGAAPDFGEGKVAMKVSGSWMMSEVGSDFPDMLAKTGVAPFVTSAAGNDRTATTLGDFKWVVDGKAKNAEGAGDFLQWALAGDPENLVDFFVVTQFTKVPVRESVIEAVSATGGAQEAPWSGVVMNDIAPTAIPGPTYPWDVLLSVGTAMETYMKGAADFDTAIATAESEINTIIEREDLPSKAPKN